MTKQDQKWQRDGRTLYLLNDAGVNRFDMTVHGGWNADDSARVTLNEAEQMAASILLAVNAHAALVQACEMAEIWFRGSVLSAQEQAIVGALRAALSATYPHDPDKLYEVRVQVDQKVLVMGSTEEIVKEAFREGYERCKSDMDVELTALWKKIEEEFLLPLWHHYSEEDDAEYLAPMRAALAKLT